MHRIELPSALPPRFSTAASRANGVTRSRLRASDLEPTFRGMRSVGPAASLADRASALATLLPPVAAFSHHTSAALLGCPLPRGSDADLHVTLPRDAHRIRRPGVICHRADRPHDIHRGLPVVAAGVTWCDLASCLSRTDLVIAGDHLLRVDLVSIEDLRGLVCDRRSARGCRAALEALPLLRPGSASAMETAARLQFHDWGLPEPELNVSIVEYDGWVATVDFLWRAQRVVAEYYGEVHQGSWRNDLARTAQLEDAGHRVVVVTRRDLGVGALDLCRRLTRLLVP